MSQKWYQKASVQSAIVIGVFSIIAAVITALLGNNNLKLFNNNKNDIKSSSNFELFNNNKNDIKSGISKGVDKSTPVIINTWIGSAHSSDRIIGREWYSRFLLLTVDDPKGYDNILSVKAVDSHQREYILTDSKWTPTSVTGDGVYENWEHFKSPFPSDKYNFTVTNKDGNYVSLTASITNHITDIPIVIYPDHRQIILENTPTFRWKVINNITGYWVTICRPDGKGFWRYLVMAPSTSVEYNIDGSASLNTLKSGQDYNLSIVAMDSNGNWSMSTTRFLVKK